MPATSQYHIVLDGQGYLIDLGSYRKRVHDPFAPKDRSGDAQYGDLALPSVWAMENWQQGFGFDNWVSSWSNEKAGYDTGTAIDPRYGDLRLGRNVLAVYQPGSSKTDLEGLIAYQGSLYTWRPDSGEIISSSDGTTWSVAFTANQAGHKCAAVFDGDLWFGSATDNTLTRYDTSAWTDDAKTLSNAASTVTAMATWYAGGAAERLYVGYTRSTPTPDQAALDYVPTSGAVVAVATFPYPTVEALMVHDGLLWIALSEVIGTQDRKGALYTHNGTKVELVAELDDNSITAFHEYGGKLYAGSAIRGKIWTVDAGGLTEVFSFPDVAGIGGVSTYGLPIRQMVVDDGRLHVPIVETNGLGIYSFDGTGWAYVAAGGLGQEPRGIAAYKNDLYLSNKSSAGARIYKVERKSPTSGVWVSSAFTAGLRGTVKVWLKLEIYHSALVAGDSIAIAYQRDANGIWTTLGTSDADGATSATFFFPTVTQSRALQLRLIFTVTDQTKSPKVTALLTHYLVSTDMKAEWQFDVLLEGSAQTPLVRLDNSNEPSTGPALADALWASRNKFGTLSFTDLDAEAKTVHFVDCEERVSPGATQRLGHQTRGKVTLVEA